MPANLNQCSLLPEKNYYVADILKNAWLMVLPASILNEGSNNAHRPMLNKKRSGIASLIRR
jgi:hypothetical protein